MRTNIDIDDTLMASAMRAGPFSTKREAVEADLRLLTRQTAYRDILSLRGQLRWDDGATLTSAPAHTLHAPAAPPYLAKATKTTRTAQTTPRSKARK